MKILQLSKYYPPTFGGLEIVAEFFSRASRDLGIDVDVLSVGGEEKFYKGQYAENVYQAKEDIKLKSSPLSLGYLKNVKKILNDNQIKAIFVHLPNPFSHELLKIFKNTIKKKGIRVYGIYHSDIINQVTLRDIYNFYFKQDIDLYDYFICSSFELKKSSAILSELPDHKIKVIPFCIDHRFSKKDLSDQRPPTKRLLSIGRMVPYKGFHFLVKAFQDLPYELTIVGGGPLLQDLKRIASPNIHFIGEVSEEEKFKLFLNHDALIVSSINRAEAYGMTIVEAFSVGLPVIASDIDTGVSFLVRDGVTGFKFPIQDKIALGQRLDQFFQSTQERLRMSKNCSDFFDRELNYASFKKNISALFSEI